MMNYVLECPKFNQRVIKNEQNVKDSEKTETPYKTGRECRKAFGKQTVKTRLVPAFTYQTFQVNTIVQDPPKSIIYKKRPVRSTLFSLYLLRGDIPVKVSGAPIKMKESKQFPIQWLCKPENLDYCYYLPIFIDGISDSNVELRNLAQYSAMDLIVRAPTKILPVLPQLILPLKQAFNTRDKKIIITALKVIQLMVLLGPCVGQALVPYYRQLLPICNMFKQINVNLGDGIDDNRDNRIGDVIEDTLQILERCGGPDAYINIKYMVPTYESCVLN